MMLRIRFGEFVLDERCYVLERAEGPVALRPKAFDLLLHLARHHDRVVLRDELIHAVWGATRVGPGSLAGLVNEVRQALRERGRTGSVIRTVHGRGYQLVAPVVELEAAQDGWPERAPTPHGRAELARFIREAIGHVSAIGPVGLIARSDAEDGDVEQEGDARSDGARGTAGLVDAVEVRCREAGFERIPLSVPAEAMVTPGRLAGDLLAALIGVRPRREVATALPLPARLWLESPAREAFAGGRDAPALGLPGGLSAIAAAIGRCAARTPILLRIDELERAGVGYVRDLLRLLRDLEAAPVLVCVTLADGTGADEISRLLEADGVFRSLPASAASAGARTAATATAEVPFTSPDALPRTSGPPPIAPDAARAALERWRDAWAIETLPVEVEAALLAHLCGERPLELAHRAGARGETDDPPRPGLRRVAPRSDDRIAQPGRS